MGSPDWQLSSCCRSASPPVQPVRPRRRSWGQTDAHGIPAIAPLIETVGGAAVDIAVVSKPAAQTLPLLPNPFLQPVLPPQDDTPAQRAGLAAGDVIAAANPATVASTRDIEHAGAAVADVLSIRRDGRHVPIALRL